MNETEFALDNYDLKGFIGESIDFLKEQGMGDPDPVSAIPVVGEDYSIADLSGDASERILYDELVKEQKYLYFPFSGTKDEDSIPCADGREYPIPETDEQPIGYDEFKLNGTDTVGFLVKVSNGKISFKSVRQIHEGDTVQPENNTGIFEDGMIRFIKKFTFDI